MLSKVSKIFRLQNSSENCLEITANLYWFILTQRQKKKKIISFCSLHAVRKLPRDRQQSVHFRKK